MDYVDPGASSYEIRYRARVIDNLHLRAKAFGFMLHGLAAKIAIDPTIFEKYSQAALSAGCRRYLAYRQVINPISQFIGRETANATILRESF
jgi:hypothetical protein